MATERPRLSVTLDAELMEAMNRFRVQNRISTQSRAISQLIRMALDELVLSGASDDGGAAPSKEALQLARDYQNLDRWGRQLIRTLVEHEKARAAEAARLGDVLEDQEAKVIPLYLFPAAAGYAAPVMNEEFELYELTEDDPPAAEFAVRLQGDSMEPDFPDGSIVFCNHDPLAAGDIGIFYLDSGTVCKQYYKDPAGFVYLFSLNRKRSGADLLISPNGNRTFVCQGRVITRKRYPIPGRD